MKILERLGQTNQLFSLYTLQCKPHATT